MLSHCQWLPMFTGLMGLIGFFVFSGEEISATFLFFRTLFAFGLVGLRLTLWREKPIQPTSAAKASGLSHTFLRSAGRLSGSECF
jgi:hypothetical protein